MRPTKFNRTTGEVEVSISAADVASPDASVQVTVVNPDPGGVSNAITFIINPLANGAPTLTSFNPPNVVAGTAGPFMVSVAGTGFVPTSVVNWNGSPRLTTFISASQLTVNFTTQDLATPGFGSISVTNPAPGGGVSPSVDFPVN
jgi:trimeric autotransporter adhesin